MCQNALGDLHGFGYYFLYSAFAGTVSLTDMRSVIYYLFSGSVMFAPYLAKQLQSARFVGAVAAAPQTVQIVQPAATPALVLVRSSAVG
jgi:hypothetical protein